MSLSGTRRPYRLPQWAEGRFRNPPEHGKLLLGSLPSPLYRIDTREQPSALSPTDNDNGNSRYQRSVISIFRKRGVNLWIKRDDMTGGVELGGNKVRKLEFLLADALANRCNSVVTIGGEQSNHCRATASAARMVGLRPHLILRTKRANDAVVVAAAADADTNQKDRPAAAGLQGNPKDESDTAASCEQTDNFGTAGNILVDRMVGSSIYTCTPGEYGRIGSQALVERLAEYLRTNVGDERPYCIPVGGSNGLGTYGYIQAVDELSQQVQNLNGGDVGSCNRSDGIDDDRPGSAVNGANQESDESVSFDHVVFASGSGGTAAGLALGFALCPALQSAQLHAIGVCDTPEYFYETITRIVEDDMGFRLDETDDDGNDTGGDIGSYLRKRLTVHQGKGLGYAVSTVEELDFVRQFATETGVVLDPVYSGKALYHFVHHVLPGKGKAEPVTADGCREQADDSGSSTKMTDQFRGSNVLFWHTGGALGLFDKVEDLSLSRQSPVQRLDVYGRRRQFARNSQGSTGGRQDRTDDAGADDGESPTLSSAERSPHIQI